MQCQNDLESRQVI
ncbi:unnamed protein product [Leptidea sinapis]|uniref:Uncharacterized protein n=1 Tax=Leptidea sinapis TaxID=189913 RepID=A0A5E4QV11_9NEOP|nr:unnamed protein product [Leptidea sinapis]